MVASAWTKVSVVSRCGGEQKPHSRAEAIEERQLLRCAQRWKVERFVVFGAAAQAGFQEGAQRQDTEPAQGLDGGWKVVLPTHLHPDGREAAGGAHADHGHPGGTGSLEIRADEQVDAGLGAFDAADIVHDVVERVADLHDGPAWFTKLRHREHDRSEAGVGEGVGIDREVVRGDDEPVLGGLEVFEPVKVVVPEGFDPQRLRPRFDPMGEGISPQPGLDRQGIGAFLSLEYRNHRRPSCRSAENAVVQPTVNDQPAPRILGAPHPAGVNPPDIGVIDEGIRRRGG